MSKIKSVLRAILKALAEGRFLHWVVQRIDKVGAWISRYLICRFTRVQKNTIVFMTYGNNYFCNPKYIAEEILRQKLPWRLVWVTAPKKGKAKRGDVPMEIEVVKRNSFEAIRATAQAKVWVDNAINFYWDRNPHKKKSQVYLQTWHGSMGIKRMGEDNVQSPRWVRTAKKTGKNTDYCISNSDFETMVFRTSYWKDEQANQILMYGHARNDCLFQPEKCAALRKNIAERYGFDPEEKIFLYAPTFRDSGYQEYKNLDFKALTQALHERFGGKWRIFLRMHFHDRGKKVTINPGDDYLTNVTAYPDMQQLIMISDIGMTDYSSWAYDFVLTRRPLFIYASDLDEYNNERGLYYPLESTPFPVAENNEMLLNNVRQFDDVAYHEKVEAFLQDKGCIEDGHAAERVVEKLKEIMGEKK